jgi:hypothetical protein
VKPATATANYPTPRSPAAVETPALRIIETYKHPTFDMACEQFDLVADLLQMAAQSAIGIALPRAVLPPEQRGRKQAFAERADAAGASLAGRMATQLAAVSAHLF